LARTFSARPRASSSSNARRETTRLAPRRSTSYRVTRKASLRPTYSLASATWRVSSCEIGQKPRTPATNTSTPPLLIAVTVPSTARPSWAACCSSTLASGPRATVRRKTTEPCLPMVSTTRASTSSPTWTLKLPSASRSCPTSIMPSTAPPAISTTAVSRPILTTRPRTVSPTRASARAVVRSRVSNSASMAAKSWFVLLGWSLSLMAAFHTCFPPGMHAGSAPGFVVLQARHARRAR